MIPREILGAKTLLLDLDGTLINSALLAKSALRGALKSFHDARGLETPTYTDEELIGRIGLPSNEFYRDLLAPDHLDEWEQFREEVYREEKAYMKRHRVTFPGAVSTLEELRDRGYKLAIISNCSSPYLQTVLETQGIGRFIDQALCAGDDDHTTKSQLIGRILEQLPTPAVMIGDRAFDVEAAAEHGVPTVGALYGFGPREELMDTATWVQDIRHLLHAFHPLRERAEEIAAHINRLRPLDRPLVVALSGPHFAVSNRLGSLLISELTDRNIPVCHVDLAQHFRMDAEGDDKALFPWDRLDREVLSAAREGRVDTAFELAGADDAPKPCRARAGSVVLVEGPFLVNNPHLKDDFDLAFFIQADDKGVHRAIRDSYQQQVRRERRAGVQVDEAKEHASNIREQQLTLWQRWLKEMSDAYEKEALPAEHADGVLDGNRLQRGLWLKRPEA